MTETQAIIGVVIWAFIVLMALFILVFPVDKE